MLLKSTRILLLLSISLSTKDTVAGDDFGFTHGITTYIAGEILEDINNQLFPAEVARWVTNLEMSGIVYYYCNKEAEARETWNMLEWQPDSFLDCAAPAAMASNKIIIGKDSVLVNVIDLKW